MPGAYLTQQNLMYKQKLRPSRHFREKKASDQAKISETIEF